MRRGIHVFCMGLSLVLCVATVVVWVRSYTWATGAAVGRVNRPELRIDGLSVVGYRGALDVRYLIWKYGDPTLSLWDRSGTHWNWGTFNEPLAETPWEPVHWKLLGFWYGYSDDGARRDWYVTAPLGLFVIVFAVKPGRVGYFWWRGRRRKRRNQCVSCGYSRRANTSGVCPECGAKLEKAGGGDLKQKAIAGRRKGRRVVRR